MPRGPAPLSFALALALACVDGEDPSAYLEQTPLVVTCTVELGEHDPELPGAAAIVSDRELHCDDPTFSFAGFRVAPTPAGVVLATSGSAGVYLFRGDQRLDALPRDLDLGNTPVALDQDEQGRVHLAVVAHDPDQAGQALIYLHPDPDSEPDPELAAPRWLPEPITAAAGFALADLAFDPAGQPRVWFLRDGAPAWEQMLRGPNGGWSQRFSPAAAGTWPRFVIDDQGQVVTSFFEVDEYGIKWPVFQVEGHERVERFTNAHPDAHLRAIGAPRPGFADDPSLPATLNLIDQPYEVLPWWLDEGGEITHADLGLSAIYEACFPGKAPDCSGSCVDDDTGTMVNFVTLARTHDGRIWGVWVERQGPRTFHSEQRCDGGDCWCERYLLEDHSVHTLVVAPFVDPSGLPSDPADHRLRLPIAAPQTKGMVSDRADVGWGIEARGFGDRLGIAVRTQAGASAGDLGTTLRVLEIDTAQWP